MKPALLDLFCCEGGAGTGYTRSGFAVVGIDLKPQPRYPFEFHQGDALEYLREHGGEFDAIHASPPCQSYSRAMRHMATPQPMLIDTVRDLLRASGKPWIIENVKGSPLANCTELYGAHGVELCGTMFGLRVYRHRIFETSFHLTPPRKCDHSRHAYNPHRSESRDRIYAEFGRQDPEVLWAKMMGVEWMSRHGARECIPPAYTEVIGRKLIEHLAR